MDCPLFDTHQYEAARVHVFDLAATSLGPPKREKICHFSLPKRPVEPRTRGPRIQISWQVQVAWQVQGRWQGGRAGGMAARHGRVIGLDKEGSGVSKFALR